MWPVATMAGGVNNHALRVLILCVLWYIVSSSNNVIGKTLLMRFSYPMTVTMVQLVSITVYSGPLFKLWGVRTRMEYGSKYWWRVIIPLAFGKFVASVSAHVSLWKVSVSYSHTGGELDWKYVLGLVSLCILWVAISTAMNVINKVVLMRLPYPVTVAGVQLLSIVVFNFSFVTSCNLSSDKEQYISWKYHCMFIIPLAFGKFVTSVASHFGLWKISLSYMQTVKASMPLFTVILTRVLFGEIQPRSVLLDTGIHHLRLLQLLGQLALLMFLPLWLLSDCRTILSDSSIFEGNFQETILLLFMDGFLNWLQNIIAFSVLSLVTPLSYAVANASKRICIISISLLTLRNPVTPLNIFGMMLAIIGVFLYNKVQAKYDAHRQAKAKPILPVIKGPSEASKSLLFSDVADTLPRNSYHLSLPPEGNGPYRSSLGDTKLNEIEKSHQVFARLGNANFQDFSTTECAGFDLQESDEALRGARYIV
ncbi:unnamed protein product, partial [Darwinula stevensoni]